MKMRTIAGSWGRQYDGHGSGLWGRDVAGEGGGKGRWFLREEAAASEARMYKWGQLLRNGVGARGKHGEDGEKEV